jgi:uracil-DNA glycosylase
MNIFEKYPYINDCWKHIFIKHNDIINNIFDKSLDYELPIYPPDKQIFRVFSMNVSDIKIVFLGQDSYHGKGQANGLAFSVNNDVKIPPSLNNIFKELKNTYPDRNYEFRNGNLERWFHEEKIFLLNCGLSVLEGHPSIFIKDWRPFTDDIIKFISDNNKDCIFLLLGNYAKDKIKFIDNQDKCIMGVHPSPLSANRGFFGSNIFKEIDKKIGYDVNWST